MLHDAQEPEDNEADEQTAFLPSVETESISTAQRTPLRRQPSSLIQPGAPRTPRTPNRVRFDLQDVGDLPNGHARSSSHEPEEWPEEEDYTHQGRRGSGAQSAPLLTGIEAPSVTAALEINLDDLLENARPKSGLSSAFMNMANSIIGAGIIGRSSHDVEEMQSAHEDHTGQPYAFKQAGMVTGLLLLVILTVVVCFFQYSVILTPGSYHSGRLDHTVRRQ